MYSVFKKTSSLLSNATSLLWQCPHLILKKISSLRQKIIIVKMCLLLTGNSMIFHVIFGFWQSPAVIRHSASSNIKHRIFCGIQYFHHVIGNSEYFCWPLYHQTSYLPFEVWIVDKKLVSPLPTVESIIAITYCCDKRSCNYHDTNFGVSWWRDAN